MTLSKYKQFFIVSTFFFAILFSVDVHAEEFTPDDYACIGQGLTDYMNNTIAATGGCAAGGNLEGLGIFTNGNGVAQAYVDAVQPNVVLLYDNFGWASNIPGATTVVGRSSAFSDAVPPSFITGMVSDTLGPLMSSNPAVDVWQAYNEPMYHLIGEQGISESVAFDWLLKHDTELIQTGEANGKGVCIGNFKEGWPRNVNSTAFDNYINIIMPVANNASVPVYLCVHEHESATSNGGTWTFGTRYNGRFVQLKNQGLNLPVIVTVSGYDSEAGPTVGSGQGWVDNISASTYLNMLLSYQASAKAAGAIGVSVFQLGLGGQWDSYDVAPLMLTGSGESCEGTLKFIKFLSPAFNMTNNVGSSIASNMDIDSFSQLAGIAGNTYNIGETSGVGWVESFMMNSGLINTDLPIMITETGDIESGSNVAEPINEDFTRLSNLVSAFQNNTSSTSPPLKYLGFLYFNPFMNMGNLGWSQFSMDDGFINSVCSGCSKGGANSGVFYYSNPAFYDKTSGLGMKYILEISNADSATTDGVKAALDRGLTPIIRVGTGVSAGPSAFMYGMYLQQLDQDLLDAGYTPGVHKVYAIAGPNEPQSECWATPQCYSSEECTVEQEIQVNFSGTVRTVLPTSNPVTGSTQSGAPVHGANIGFYQGRWDTDSGNIHGNIFRTGSVATDGQGRFSKTVTFRGPFDNSAYVMVWCGNNYADGWKMRLDSPDIKKDFFVPCALNNYDDIKEPPPTFNLSNMGEPLACGIQKNYDSGTKATSEIAPGYSKPIILEKPDFDDSYNGQTIGRDGSGLPPRRITEAKVPFPGRNDISKLRSSYSAVAKIAGTYGLGRIDPVVEGKEKKDILETCEAIRQCNLGVGDSDGVLLRNSHVCYSYATKLSYPGMWESLYPRALGLDPSVCIDDSGDEVKLSEIEPPSDLAHLGPSGPFKYKQIDGDYFPYLYLLGDPDAGVAGQGVDEATSDSFTPNTNVLQGTVRDDPLTSGNNETSQKSVSTNELQAGLPEFSAETATWLVNSDIVQSDLGIGAGSANSALGGLMADPFLSFGTNHPNLNDNVYAVAGNSDFQISRPYQLCSYNSNDVGATAPFNEYDSASADAEKHPWVSGFSYLPENQGGLVSTIAACLRNFKKCLYRFFDGETVDATNYDRPPVPVQVICPGPVRDKDGDGEDDFNGGSRPSGPCVSWQDRGTCNPVADPNFCDVGSCVLSNGSQCSDIYKQDEIITFCADPTFDGTCTFNVPVYSCNCSLRAEFQANHYNFSDVRDILQADGLLNAGLYYDVPFNKHRACGSLNTIDYEVTDQEDQDYATSAFNSGGPGCTEDRLGELFIGTVSDPVFGTEDDAPDYSGVMSN